MENSEEKSTKPSLKKQVLIIGSILAVLLIVAGAIIAFDAYRENQEREAFNEQDNAREELEKAGSYDEVIQNFEDVKEESASLEVKRDSLTKIGISYMNKGNYYSAHNAFTEAYDLNIEPSGELLRSAVYAAEEIGEYEVAIQYYEDLIALEPNDSHNSELMIEYYQEQIERLKEEMQQRTTNGTN